jgi:hypothetical protein
MASIRAKSERSGNLQLRQIIRIAVVQYAMKILKDKSGSEEKLDLARQVLINPEMMSERIASLAILDDNIDDNSDDNRIMNAVGSIFDMIAG